MVSGSKQLFPRINTMVKVEIVKIGATEKISGESRNLSETGIYIICDNNEQQKLKLEEKCKLTVFLDEHGKSFSVNSKVARVDDQGIALLFEEINVADDSFLLFESFIHSNLDHALEEQDDAEEAEEQSSCEAWAKAK